MKTLPHKPSDLIRVAIVDLEKAEKSDKYRIEMEDWHAPKSDKICEVCLAGSVMAFTLEWDPSKDLNPNDNDNPELLQNQLYALNEFREGYVNFGFSYLSNTDEYKEFEDYDVLSEPFNREITPYREDSELFKREMITLASDLEKAGY